MTDEGAALATESLPPTPALAPPRPWWRCPGAMALLHAQRTFFGLAVAWPLARWVSERMNGRPGGDATLFDDGGVLLAEALRVGAPLVRPLVGAGLFVSVLAFLVGHFALAALLDALARPEPVGMRARIAAAAGPIPQMALASLGALFLAAAVLGLVWWSGKAFVQAAFDAPPAIDVAMLAVLSLGLLASSWVGVLQDLLFAAFVGRRLGFMPALALAWETLRGRMLGLWAQRAVRTAGAAVVVVAAALAAIRVGMRAPGEAAVAQALLEASLVAVTCLRASWLGIATEAIRRRASESEVVASALPDAMDSSKNPPAATPR